MGKPGSYISVIEVGTSESGITKIWGVFSSDDHLGDIKWWPAWRKYVFFPLAGTLYEQDCMREIAEFIETQTTEHKEARKAAKSG